MPVFSLLAILGAVGVVLGLGPMLAVAAMFLAALAYARGEELAGIAVLLGVLALFWAFLLPSALWSPTL